MMLQTSAKAKKVRFDKKCPLTSLFMMFQVDYSVDYRADYGGGIGSYQPHERQEASASFDQVFYNQDHFDYQNYQDFY